MLNLPERVEHSIRERTLFRRGEKILVAVSGGLDSMVLLDVLAQLAKAHQWKLIVAHYNHQLRGRSSDADERLVKKTATSLDLPFHAGSGDVKSLSRTSGGSIEMAARELRHAFLVNAARKFRCRVIATAHHSDDQVELFFIRLLRGAGGEGLAGMKWNAESPADRKLRIVRPLLNVEKAALAEFAKEAGITFREDASNRSTDILRNRVRLELLPLLRRRFNPAVDKSISRLMEIVGAEAEIVTALAEEWLADGVAGRARHSVRADVCLAKTGAHGVTRPTSASQLGGCFKECQVAVQRRIIQLQLQHLGVMADFELIESLRVEPEKSISVGREVWVQSDDSGLVKKVSPPVRGFNDGVARVTLGNRAGKTEFSGAHISWEFATNGKHQIGCGVRGMEAFDAEKVGGRIALRHWQAGDRFQPIGMKSAVKLQDWFTNQKISAARRRELIVATTERGEVFWVEGLRIGERFKLGKLTRRRLVWRWIRQ